MKHEFQKTKDGSDTLYIPEMDEAYHSSAGALTESLHIFIWNGVQVVQKNQLRILEIGFGTGLNAWLTLLEAEESKRNIEYITYELYPLQKDIYEKLNFPEVYNPAMKELFNEIQNAGWNEMVKINDLFTIHKKQEDVTKASIEENIDVIFFDAFAPAKQPELWTFEMFSKMYQSLNHKGILVTYCAKGEVRRTMQAAGFKTERLAGPPAGKREMLRGNKVQYSGSMFFDGRNETWAFTEIDQTAGLGISIVPAFLNRTKDVIGIAGVINGISPDHRLYLKQGGYGFMIGDGTLNYGNEMIAELYYNFHIHDNPFFITPGYQFIANPAYNKDRGPVNIFSIRVHTRF